MTLQDLGNIGELVGAIGVIASLVYLAVQIRQNTTSVRASMFQEAARDIAASSDVLAADADLARIWRTGLADLDTLQPDERQRFAAYTVGLLRRLENTLHQTQHGPLDPAYGQAVLASMRFLGTQPGFVAWWSRAHQMFSPDFQNFVGREVIQRNGGAA